MEFKSNEVKAGLMISVSVVVLITFLIAIFGIEFGKDTKEYQTRLEYVGGILRGSLVKFGGMDVGKVTGIYLPDAAGDDTKITVAITVAAETPIRIDSEAYLTATGLMKDQHIEISPGSPSAALLPSGSTLNSREVLSFTQMAEPLGQLSDQAQELMARFSDIFNEDNRAHFSSVIAGMDTLLSDGRANLLGMVDNLEHLTANLSNLSSDFNELLTSNRGNFDGTFAQLQETTEETTKLISDLRRTLGVFENMMSSNTTNIVEIMENFQFASQNLEEFTRILKERPWLLVRKAGPPQRKTP